MKRRGEALRRQGLTAANLYTCWLCRWISPLKRRPHLMCAYTGYDDPSRDYPEDLSFDGLKAIMPAYTSVVPVCEDAAELRSTFLS